MEWNLTFLWDYLLVSRRVNNSSDGRNLGAKLIHRIGSFIVGKYDNMHHIVEVVTDMTPSNGPLHGAVWQALSNFGSQDFNEIHSYINREICFMEKNYEAHSVYLNCKCYIIMFIGLSLVW